MAEESISRTWRVSREIAERIRALAVATEVYDSSIVNYLLTRALDDLDAGRMVIRRRPVAYVIDDRPA